MPRGVKATLDPSQWLAQAERAVEAATAAVDKAKAAKDKADERVEKATAKQNEAAEDLAAAEAQKAQAQEYVNLLQNRNGAVPQAVTPVPEPEPVDEPVA